MLVSLYQQKELLIIIVRKIENWILKAQMMNY
jgi:hypothetical protein